MEELRYQTAGPHFRKHSAPAFRFRVAQMVLLSILARSWRARPQSLSPLYASGRPRYLSQTILTSHPHDQARPPHPLNAQESRVPPIKYLPIRQAVVNIRNVNEGTTIQEISHELKALRPDPVSSQQWKDSVKDIRHALVLLLTPKLAHFLLERSFIPEILKAINGKDVYSEGLHLDVVCGVVDSMPPTIQRVKQNVGSSIKDGITVMYGESQRIVPNLEKAKQIDVHSQREPGSISFASGLQGTKVTVPLANTLFTNGKLSTLTFSKWKTSEDGHDYVQEGTFAGLHSISIWALRSKTSPGTVTDFFIPAVPLTPARSIVEGYGNIVRTLQFGSNDIQGASLELETKVPKFLAEVSKDPSLDIWALLIPSDLFAEFRATVPTASRSRVNKTPIQKSSEIASWLMRGARLCRVQSGGGGWGAKAGLLSLDPQTSYNPEQPNLEDFAFEDISVKGLGDIAKSKQMIQFFTARKTVIPIPKPPARTQKGAREHRTIILGTLPSSVDASPLNSEEQQAQTDSAIISRDEAARLNAKIMELMKAPFPDVKKSGNDHRQPESAVAYEGGQSPTSRSVTPGETQSEKDTDVSQTTHHTESQISLEPGYFGFASEGGVYLDSNIYNSQTKQYSRVQTKVSIPYSYLWRVHGLNANKQTSLSKKGPDAKKPSALTLKKESPSYEPSGFKIRRVKVGKSDETPESSSTSQECEPYVDTNPLGRGTRFEAMQKYSAAKRNSATGNANQDGEISQ